MFAVNQTIPLSSSTRAALREHGGRIYRRDRTLDDVIRLARDADAEFVLNFGSRSNTPLVRENLDFVWTPPHMIQAVGHPANLRRTLPELVPPQPDEFPAQVWLKAPGQRGQGKTKIETFGRIVLPENWDWQLHIEGTEYRAITVGHRMVQGFLREGTNDAREYTWTGLRDTPVAIKERARMAARALHARSTMGVPGVPGHLERRDPAHTGLFAWDLILDEHGSAFILEANSSPGLGSATVERIVREIRRQREERTNVIS